MKKKSSSSFVCPWSLNRKLKSHHPEKRPTKNHTQDEKVFSPQKQHLEFNPSQVNQEKGSAILRLVVREETLIPNRIGFP